MAFKRSVEDKILSSVIERYFLPLFSGQGYAFRKSKNDLIKKGKPINRIIWLRRSHIFIKNRTDVSSVELSINLNWKLEETEYANWYREISNQQEFIFSHSIFSKTIILEIDHLEFYTIVTGKTPKENSDAHYFSNEALDKSSDGSITDDECRYVDFKENLLPQLLIKSENLSSIEKIFQDSNFKQRPDYYSILAYIGKKEGLKVYTDFHFEHYVSKLKEGNDRYKQYLEDFIPFAEKLTGIKYEVPKE